MQNLENQENKDGSKKPAQPKLGRKRLLIILLVVCLCIGGIYAGSWIDNRRIVVSYYPVYSENVDKPVRAVILSDLHQKKFGKGNVRLIKQVESLEPDIILISGDTINSGNPDIKYAVDLCSALKDIAPVYFGMGNHENRVVYGTDLKKDYLDKIGFKDSGDPGDFSTLIKDSSLLDGLRDIDVPVLQNSSVVTEVNGNSIAIGGISTNLDAAWTYSGKFIMDFVEENDTSCKIMLSHFPEPAVRNLDGVDLDLIVAGHNHGGIIRLPGVGGLYSYGEGFFPEHDGGITDVGGSPLVVSRGLGNHGLIPRLFNPPELVVVDIS